MADFNDHFEELEKLGVGVVALSVDAEKYAQKTQDRHNLKFPLLYGLDGPAVAAELGSFTDDEKGFFHATNFIVRNGKVVHATYSTGPLGRLRAKNVAGLVGFYQKQESKAAEAKADG